MTAVVVERRRTGWDVVLGLVLVIGGVAVLGHVALATAVSVLFLGWTAVIAGITALVSAVVRIRQGGFWVGALTGALLLVLGVVMLRNPLVAAVSLTLVAGSLFLVGGVVRLVAAAGSREYRWALVLSGLVSVGLGLLVLLNPVEASLTLLGILLGIEAISDGVAMMLLGRPRLREVDTVVPSASRATV
ncbi:MAG: DUF308 domain-containing protein [Actinotalea sp.]|nr:DUF308 domain-containing protein [Actinotalea sp.]